MEKTGLKCIKDYFEYRDGWLYHDDKLKGSTGTNGYVYVYHYRKKLYAHRVIFFLHYGYWPKYVDHINRDKQDNLIENLRDVSQTINLRNREGIKGYTWDREHSKWRSQVSLKDKQIYLGLFDTEEEAANAYKEYVKNESV